MRKRRKYGFVDLRHGTGYEERRKRRSSDPGRFDPGVGGRNWSTGATPITSEDCDPAPCQHLRVSTSAGRGPGPSGRVWRIEKRPARGLRARRIVARGGRTVPPGRRLAATDANVLSFGVRAARGDRCGLSTVTTDSRSGGHRPPPLMLANARGSARGRHPGRDSQGRRTFRAIAAQIRGASRVELANSRRGKAAPRILMPSPRSRWRKSSAATRGSLTENSPRSLGLRRRVFASRSAPCRRSRPMRFFFVAELHRDSRRHEDAAAPRLCRDRVAHLERQGPSSVTKAGPLRGAA